MKRVNIEETTTEVEESKTVTLVIKGEMTDLNTYINAERSNRYKGAAIKKEETDRVNWECRIQKLPKFKRKVNVCYWIYSKDERKDEDNLLIYTKWINDGMRDAGVIVNDSRQYLHIAGIYLEVDREHPHIDVEIY